MMMGLLRKAQCCPSQCKSEPDGKCSLCAWCVSCNHNGCANLDEALSDFAWFLENLKTLHLLIGRQGRRQRFLEVALKGTPHYDQGKSVLHAFNTLHQERWGELAEYLSQGFPILVFLRQHWDAVATCVVVSSSQTSFSQPPGT